MKTLKLTSMVIASLLFVFTSCQKEDVSPSSGAGSSNTQSGSFEVKMTDAPGNYAALDVQITGVDVYLENDGWVSLNHEIQHVSVLKLTNGIETLLAYKGMAKVGTYSKLRITFGNENSLTFNGGTNVGGVSGNGSATVQLLWDGPREVIIEIDEEVSANSEAEVLLDFQVVQSIKEVAQQYIIDPVITEIKDATTGLRGQVQGVVNAAVIIKNGSNEVSTYLDASGNFLVRGLDEGVYDLIVIPEASESEIPQEQHIENILISKGEIKHVGIISF
ncbi:MAG: DUF4382 domain-containing protein [Flavobacteriales bacterium]